MGLVSSLSSLSVWFPFFLSFLGLLLDTAPLAVCMYVCVHLQFVITVDLGTYKSLAPEVKVAIWLK